MPSAEQPSEAVKVAQELHYDLLNQPQISNHEFHQSLQTLEKSATAWVAQIPEDVGVFAQLMNETYSRSAADELNIQPPLTSEQRAVLVGKITVYKALLESFTPKSAILSATPTKPLKTDDPKTSKSRKR